MTCHITECWQALKTDVASSSRSGNSHQFCDAILASFDLGFECLDVFEFVVLMMVIYTIIRPVSFPKVTVRIQKSKLKRVMRLRETSRRKVSHVHRHFLLLPSKNSVQVVSVCLLHFRQLRKALFRLVNSVHMAVIPFGLSRLHVSLHSDKLPMACV